MKQSNDVANNYIPKDYEDLYLYYIHGDGNGNSLCHKIIRSILSHSTQDERETLAHDVFERIMKSGMLGKFDPNKANFGGVIFFVTRSIVVNHLDRKGRTPLTGLNGGSLVITDPDDETFEPGVYTLERLFQADIPDAGDALDASTLVENLIIWAKKLHDKPAHKRDAIIEIQREMRRGLRGLTAVFNSEVLNSLVFDIAIYNYMTEEERVLLQAAKKRLDVHP